MRVRREQVDEHLHLVDEHRGERLHPLDGHALGQLVGDLRELGVLLAELGRASSYVVGEQQLATGRRPEPLDPTLSAESWCAGRRRAKLRISSISSPKNSTRSGCSSVGGKTSTMPPRTANSPRFSTRSTREYAAPTSRRTTSSSSTSWPGLQLDRLEVGQPLHLRLEHGTDRRHDDLERTVVGVAAGVLDPAQHGQPAADGVAARAQPLVRQRLPGRVERDRVGVEQVLELLGEVLGLAHGRGDDQHRAAGVDEPAHHERPQRRGTGEVERAHARLGVVHRLGEHGFTEDEVGQAGDAQRGHFSQRCRARTKTPNRCGEGVLEHC